MNIRLPDSNGINLTKKMIEKISSDTTNITQTAYASPDDVKECLNAGCDFYIPKACNFFAIPSL